MSMRQALVFTTASSVGVKSGFQAVNFPIARAMKQGNSSVARFFVASQGAAIAGQTLALMLCDTSTVYAYFTATLADLGIRDNLLNTSGGYLASVVFGETGTSNFDLLGHHGSNEEGGAQWYVGVTGAFGGITSVTVYCDASPDV